MIKKFQIKTLLFFVSLIALKTVNAQEDKNIHLTTGIGINSIQGSLSNTFRSSIAFNSGFEKSFSKHWYGQAEVAFNSLKYDQQVKDENSPYLFQNTSSSFFQVGVNWGYNFYFGKSPLFASLYGGSGFLSLGKPRITVDDQNQVVTQSIIRGNGAFGKAGGRIAASTKSSLLHTIYLDGSWLTSTVKTEGSTFRNVAVFLGIRMAMGSEGKLVKRQMKTLKRLR
jgi:hypothetical protein